jgi:signal transduction histidine kinase/AraC-like DNA-binding protein/ABC-type sugar transport system substrate-binding protein
VFPHKVNYLDIKPASLRKALRIGVLITPTDPYWIQAREAIVHANQNIGDELVFLEIASNLYELAIFPLADLIDQILAHHLDALITSHVSLPLYGNLLAAGLPIICLSELEFHHPGFSSGSSLFEAGRLAGEFMGRALKGEGQVICVTAGLEHDVTTGQSRMSGFYQGLEGHPEIQIEHIPAFWTYAQCYPSLMTSLKNRSRRIDGVFGVSDTIALAARDACRKLGLINEGSILAGLNGDPMALVAIEEGSLHATVDTSSEDLGASALYLAHQAAVGLAIPDRIQQTFQLVTRENVASFAVRKLNAIASVPSQMVGYSRQQEHDRLSQLEISTEITKQIGFLQDQDRVVQVVGEMVNNHYGLEWACIYRWSKAEEKLELYGGTLSPASSEVPPDQDLLLNQAFQTNEAIYIPDTTTSQRWQPGKEWESIRSRILLPIQLGSEVIGVLDLQSSQPVRPSLELIGLKLLASQLGMVINNADLYQEALQARKTAERANQLKSRLIANVGHEMRTPLNSILGFSQSIQRQVKAALEGDIELSLEDLGKDSRNIYQSGEHLMAMINDLLDLSRAEIGALSLYFEPFQPGPLLNDLFVAFRDSGVASAKVRWLFNIPPKLPLIRADAVRLRQILTNLLANAQRLTRQGTIILGAEVTPPYLHLWVSDTGPGVPLELQEKIFEPFNSMVQKRRPEGIGLGLSITRHLVLLHGGIITLESQPGAGSTFHVYLPLPGIAQEPLPAPRPEGEQLLLVITRQEQHPREIREMCTRQNLTPVSIQTRGDLAGALAKGKPAAVALDLVGLSAGEWEMVQQLSTVRDCAALPVILYGMDPGEKQLKTGLTNVVFKPCNNNVLKEWIEQVELGLPEQSTILIVDDDAQARQYYQKLLEISHPHCQILQAENGRQAIAILSSETPALILLDLVMPEMNGFEVLAWVRAEARTQRIPVLLISGRLLNYEDVQRLNYFRTVFLSKDILSQEETLGLLSQVGDESWPMPQPTSLLVKQTLIYLHQNYALPISRKNIAEAVGVTENYISEIFRQETTLSPWDYLNRYRIHKAKEMLLNSNESVTQIALKAGFNDPAYFSRVFHKLNGVSPLEFRQVRNNQNH